MGLIKYSDIEGLPPDHPLVIQFNKEQTDLDNYYASIEPETEADIEGEYA